MECPICENTITRPRTHCLPCWAKAVEALTHLKLVIRRLQAWADDGTIDVATHFLFARVIRAEIAALEHQMELEESTPDVAAQSKPSPGRALQIAS